MEVLELPPNWGYQKLGDLCIQGITKGTTPTTYGFQYQQTGIPFIKVENLTPPSINFTQVRVFVSSDFNTHFSRSILRTDDILFSIAGSLGKVAIVPSELDGANTNQALAIIRLNREKANHQYVMYFLLSPFIERYIAKSKVVAAQPNISLSLLSEFLIPIPFPNDPARSLETQRRIVLRLESLLAEVRSAQELQEKISLELSSLRTAFLNEIFIESGRILPDGWEWVALERLVSDTPRRNPSATAPERTFRYVDISAVDNEKGIINLDQVKSLLGKAAPSRARKVINSGDVIFATTRHYLKNIALVPEELNDNICSTGFCVLKPKPNITIPEYIYFACLSDSTIEQLNPKQRGANYPAVTDSDVYSVIVPIPFPNDKDKSINTQKQIVERLKFALKETVALQDGQTESAELIAQLEQSVLSQAFRSEL